MGNQIPKNESNESTFPNSDRTRLGFAAFLHPFTEKTVDLWFGFFLLLLCFFTKLRDTELLNRFEAVKSEVSKFD